MVEVWDARSVNNFETDLKLLHCDKVKSCSRQWCLSQDIILLPVMNFVLLSVLVRLEKESIDKAALTRIRRANNINLWQMLLILHDFLPLIQNFKNFGHSCCLFTRSKTDVVCYILIKLVLNLSLNPLLQVSNVKSLRQSINFIDNDQHSALLLVDQLVNLIDLTAFKVRYIDNIHQNRLMINLLEHLLYNLSPVRPSNMRSQADRLSSLTLSAWLLVLNELVLVP